jgi:A nuclease family of the HNH/ENDO VII superfamily with conserved AHH
MMTLSATLVSGAIADEIIMQKSAYKLRKNLCAAGVTEPAGCHHAHHIVAVAAPGAAVSRTILANAGVDLNDACNGVFVPCDQHGKLHTNVYYAKVEASLVSLPVKNRATVCGALIIIGANISSGNFP